MTTVKEALIISRRGRAGRTAARGRLCRQKIQGRLRCSLKMFGAALPGEIRARTPDRSCHFSVRTKARLGFAFCACPKICAVFIFIFSEGVLCLMWKKTALLFLFFVTFCNGSVLAEETLDRRGAFEWLAVAEREIYAQKYANAINSATNAIVLNPQMDRAFFLRGVGYAALSVYHQAIHEFTEAIRLNPGNYQYYAWRASALTERRIYDEAIEDFSKALNINPDSAAVYQRRGFAYSSMGRHADAIVDFDRALEFNAKDYWSHYQKAESCYALGLRQEALNSYKSFLEHAPSRLRQSYRDMAQSRIGELEQF